METLGSEISICYRELTSGEVSQVARQWGEKAARHLHFTDGFTILAVHGNQPVGLVSVYWRELPAPLSGVHEGYIDIIEVYPEFRRQGIARRLVRLSLERARSHGAYQVRAWSSEDKAAALALWQALGFCLCPAVTHPGGTEVHGFYASALLQPVPEVNP